MEKGWRTTGKEKSLKVDFPLVPLSLENETRWENGNEEKMTRDVIFYLYSAFPPHFSVPLSNSMFQK